MSAAAGVRIAGALRNDKPNSSAPNTDRSDPAADTRSSDEAPPRQCGALGRDILLRMVFKVENIVTVPYMSRGQSR